MNKKKIHVATYQRVIHNRIPVKEHLERDLPDFGTSVVIRLGGTKPYEKYAIQVNKAASVLNSVNKKKQKDLLLKAGAPTLPLLVRPVYPCVVKGIKRSGGINVFVVNSAKEFTKATAATNENYLIEPLFKATGEYRLHCTRKEVFFAVKKHKRNAADIIITRDNHFNEREFVKPRLWQQMKDACVKAMTTLDLDIACFDVMYNRAGAVHQFAIAEANTNPELLDNTYAAYLKALQTVITDKIAEQQPNKRVAAKEPVPVVKEPIVKRRAAGRIVANVPPVVKAQHKKVLDDVEKMNIWKKIMNDEYVINGKTVGVEL